MHGCLFGAVALFVAMLIGMLYLGYVQFQNNTHPADDANAPATTLSTSGWSRESRHHG